MVLIHKMSKQRSSLSQKGSKTSYHFPHPKFTDILLIGDNSDSGFMQASCNLLSKLRMGFWGFAHPLQDRSLSYIVAMCHLRQKEHDDSTSSSPSSGLSLAIHLGFQTQRWQLNMRVILNPSPYDMLVIEHTLIIGSLCLCCEVLNHLIVQFSSQCLILRCGYSMALTMESFSCLN